MNPERAKFYLEVMKSLTVFILGTAAGIFALMTTDGNRYFTIFLGTLCVFSIGLFLALFVYLDKNIDS